MAARKGIEHSVNFLEPPTVGDNEANGYYFNGHHIPEEVLVIILSHVPIEKILKMSLVCKTWCKMIRSDRVWSEICKRIYGQPPKKNPWFVLYAVLSDRMYFFDILSYSSRKEDRLPNQDVSRLSASSPNEPGKISPFVARLRKTNRQLVPVYTINKDTNYTYPPYFRLSCPCGCTEHFIGVGLKADKLVVYIRNKFDI